jgi:hypothetical protein
MEKERQGRCGRIPYTSCERPTREDSKPNARIVSVALGNNDTMRMVVVVANLLDSGEVKIGI